MDSNGFRFWLECQKKTAKHIRVLVPDAKRVESFYGDLDVLYGDGHLEQVISELRYTANDKRDGRPNPSRIPVPNPKSLSPYRSAVMFYKRFRESAELDTRVPDLANNMPLAHALEIGQHIELGQDLPPERKEYIRELFVRNQRHVLDLKSRYEGVCQVTGRPVLAGIAGDITEVHHIHWLTRGGKDSPENMMVVSPDIHAAIHAADGNLEWEKGEPILVIRTERIPLAVNRHLTPPK